MGLAKGREANGPRLSLHMMRPTDFALFSVFYLMAIFPLFSFLLLFFFRRVLILPNHSAFLESPVPSNGSSFIKDSLNQKQEGSQRRTLSQQHTAYISLPFFIPTAPISIYVFFRGVLNIYIRVLTPQSSYLHMLR